jgi:hypothetical protein
MKFPDHMLYHRITFLFSQPTKRFQLSETIKMVFQSPISTKSVSFNGTVRARNALHINDYSEEERQATWLNAADIQRIRRETRDTVEMMKWGFAVDEKNYSRGGLEYRTSDAIHFRRKNRSAAVKAVLNEQYRQGAGRFLDEQELAKVYKVCASPCQITAQLSARSEMRFARLLDLEFNPLKNKKLNPEIFFFSRRAALRERTLRRMSGTVA